MAALKKQKKKKLLKIFFTKPTTMKYSLLNSVFCVFKCCILSIEVCHLLLQHHLTQ